VATVSLLAKDHVIREEEVELVDRHMAESLEDPKRKRKAAKP
jgi:hypothetical protein